MRISDWSSDVCSSDLEIDRVIAAGVRFGCVLADAGYGLSASFRQALSARGLHWAVGIPRHQKVYPADVQLVFPVAGSGRPRRHHVPATASATAHVLLAAAKWLPVSGARGTTERPRWRFAGLPGSHRPRPPTPYPPCGHPPP